MQAIMNWAHDKLITTKTRPKRATRQEDLTELLAACFQKPIRIASNFLVRHPFTIFYFAHASHLSRR